jgi:hypothetical protein
VSARGPTRQLLAGVRLGLLVDDAAERASLEAALRDQGAATEQLHPDVREWLGSGRVDLALVRGARRDGGTSPSLVARQRLEFIDSLAQSERVVALLDEPPEPVLGTVWEFVLPPFHPAELIPRVLRVLAEPRPSPSMLIGNLELNVANRIVRVGGEVIPLTFNEFEIVRVLLAAHGGVVARESLERRLGGEANGRRSRRIDIHIHRLRAKLRGLSAARLETVRNVGYRFTSGRPD